MRCAWISSSTPPGTAACVSAPLASQVTAGMDLVWKKYQVFSKAAEKFLEAVREQIQIARTLTDRPFGVNIMLLSPYAAEIADLVVEEGVSAVTTGAGNPGSFIEKWKNAGIKVMPVVPSVAYAKRMQKMGADAVVVRFTALRL